MAQNMDLSSAINAKLLKLHSIIVVAVCAIFGIINFISSQFLIGAIIIAAGAAAGIIANLMRNKLSVVTIGTILTQIQLLIIIIASSVKGELHTMFPLMLASMAFAGVYLSLQNLYIHWVIMDVASVLGFVFMDAFYGNADMGLLIKGIVGINIATRADCLEGDVVEYLASLAERTVLTVELGLQTSNDESAARINRGHTFDTFCQGVAKLRAASERIGICVHIILGLPDEDDATMMQTVRDVAELHPDQVKIHLLHVLKNTRLAEMYECGEYMPLEREHYIRLVADALEMLPPDIVIARLTGDGMADDLLAPLWSRKKTTVINDIDKLLFARNTYQGKYFDKNR